MLIMIEAILLVVNQLLISTPNTPTSTNMVGQEAGKWSGIISFMDNLKWKCKISINGVLVGRKGVQRKPRRHLSNMLSRGSLKKKASKKKIMLHLSPTAGNLRGGFYFEHFTAMDGAKWLAEMKLCLVLASVEWGSSLNVTEMVKREGGGRSVTLVYLISNGSLFKRLF